MYIDGPVDTTYIWRYFVTYLTNDPLVKVLFILYGLTLVYFAIRGTKIERLTFVLPNVFFAVTVFNPFFMNRFILIFGIQDRYYRYFWMLPVVLVLCYAFVKILVKCKRIIKAALIYLLIGVIIIVGRPKLQQAGYYSAYHQYGASYYDITNIYKVDDTYATPLTLIQQDKGDCYVRLLCDLPMAQYVEQYDATIGLRFGRSEATYYPGLINTPEGVYSALETGDHVEIVKYCFYAGCIVDAGVLHDALMDFGAEYIVIQVIYPERYNMFISAGCTLVGTTHDYFVLKWGE